MLPVLCLSLHWFYCFIIFFLYFDVIHELWVLFLFSFFLFCLQYRGCGSAVQSSILQCFHASVSSLGFYWWWLGWGEREAGGWGVRRTWEVLNEAERLWKRKSPERKESLEGTNSQTEFEREKKHNKWTKNIDFPSIQSHQ